MFPYRSLFSIAFVISLAASCFSFTAGENAVYVYNIQPKDPGNAMDVKMADYIRKHLQDRSRKNLLDSRNGIPVMVHVGEDVGGDYCVKHLGQGYYLGSRSERKMIWLSYQFIKKCAMEDSSIASEDLPPCILPERDTLADFAFEYADIYMPANQNPDNTYLLGLNNLEMDWGIWGHNLSKVLGGNGDSLFGYQNMDSELFARSGGLVHQDQFCFSSDKLLELTEQFIMDQYGDGSRDHVRITIGPNDNMHVCDCARCRAAGNTPGNSTPAVLAFIKKLAVRFPGHYFFIPGYSTTMSPPREKLPSNVGVFLSAINYPRVWKDEPAHSRIRFVEMVRAWKAVTDKVYIWDYICNFDDYLSPYPILRVMQKRFKLYISLGVQGIFLNGSGYFYSCLQEMYTQILADMLVDPDVDIDRLVRDYFKANMPNVGDFYASVILSMEDHAMSMGRVLPLYGGMEDAVNSYLFEKEFREYYPVFLRARSMKMEHRERVMYEKIRQFVSFSYLEMCRLHGFEKGGFAELVGDTWKVKPEVWSAVEDLKQITDEEDLPILTGNPYSSPDHMDRVNESGVYLADYENDIELWLKSDRWNRNKLIRRPVTVRSGGSSFETKRLTDGVEGISRNYHWGWNIYPQEGLSFSVDASGLSYVRGDFYVSFFNSERHRLAPPSALEVWADGRLVGVVRKQDRGDYVDEGEKVVFHGQLYFSDVNRLELKVVPSYTANLAIDEIFFN